MWWHPASASLPVATGTAAGGAVTNVMTVDVEDYFQVSAFESHIARSQWDTFESRVAANTDRLLELFDAAGIHATFFVLGWVAQRNPGLVRSIVRAGHEVASHGYAHRLVYETSRTEFRDDLRRARAVLESASGAAVVGYRAPSYSITRQSLWALDVLIEEGYLYDASIYPIRHDRYGIPGAPRFLHLITRPGGWIWELPGATVRWAGLNLPIGGGGYFRLLPYGWTRLGLNWVNGREGRPTVFYLHPWEIDPAQPRLAGPALSRFRHYRNLAKTEGRLRQLLKDFRFATAREMVALATATRLAASPAGEAALWLETNVFQ